MVVPLNGSPQGKQQSRETVNEAPTDPHGMRVRAGRGALCRQRGGRGREEESMANSTDFGSMRNGHLKSARNGATNATGGTTSAAKAKM